MKKPKCDGCAFSVIYTPVKMVTDDDGMGVSFLHGECRRNPPTRSGFPETSKNGWCGEFVSKAAKQWT